VTRTGRLRRPQLCVRRGSVAAYQGVRLGVHRCRCCLYRRDYLLAPRFLCPGLADWEGARHCRFEDRKTWGADNVLSFLVTSFFTRGWFQPVDATPYGEIDWEKQ